MPISRIEERGEHSAAYRLSLAVVDRVDKPEVVDDCVLGGSVVAARVRSEAGCQ